MDGDGIADIVCNKKVYLNTLASDWSNYGNQHKKDELFAKISGGHDAIKGDFDFQYSSLAFTDVWTAGFPGPGFCNFWLQGMKWADLNGDGRDILICSQTDGDYYAIDKENPNAQTQITDSAEFWSEYEYI